MDGKQTRRKPTVKKVFSLLLALTMLLGASSFACAEGEKATYTTLYSSEATTLNYLIPSSTNENAVTANLIDTLVEYDRFGNIQPSLAESWESTEDQLVWTFHLRQNAVWVDYKGEEYAKVKAQDFVESARYILNAKNASETAKGLYDVIAGAEAYYKGTAEPAEGEEKAPEMAWDTVGVKALDDFTLQYTLCKPVPYFLSMLTYVNFMPVNGDFLAEKGDQFGLATSNENLLYCGAYYLSEFKPQELRVFSRNPLYWDPENVHIDEIIKKYNKESGEVAPQLYLRGEVDYTSLSVEMMQDWLADPEKAAKIHPERVTSSYTYMYLFNFDPQFDAEYEPENWRIAVNNENFRLSIINAFNRIKAKTLINPETPDELLFNTITTPGLAALNGTDYVNMGALAALSAKGADTFDKEAALAYKEAAVEELKAAGAKLPVKILLLYNKGHGNNSAEEAQLVEQQLEGVLGTDYIDVVIEAGPDKYLSARRAGQYGMMNCNWGADYADPETYTDPFRRGNNYSFIDKAADTEAIEKYYALVDAAKAITGDTQARYLAFAEAEAYLIEHGYVLPFGYGTGSYVGSLLDPFTAPTAAHGISKERFKGQYKLDDYMDTDAYFDAMDVYLAEKEAAAGAQ